jgi:hypothetical protein
MRQDRFLLGILIGIGVLIVLAVVLFFLRQGAGLSYGPDDTPEGVVRNYLVAVWRGDYEKAYGYLAAGADKPTLTDFRRAFLKGGLNPRNVAVEIGKSEVVGEQAYLPLYVSYGLNNPFGAGYRTEERVVLVREEGQWRIEEMPPGAFWDWNWYRPTPIPAPSVD